LAFFFPAFFGPFPPPKRGAPSANRDPAGMLATHFGRAVPGAGGRGGAPPFQTSPHQGGLLLRHRRQDRRTHGLLCRIGALTGGLPRTEVDAFTTFGQCLGMVFQLRDDVLDIVAVEGELGKPRRPGPCRGHLHPAGTARPRGPDVGRELGPLLGHPLGSPSGQSTRDRGRLDRHPPRPSPSGRASPPGGDRGHRRARLARALEPGSATSPTRSSSTSPAEAGARTRSGPADAGPETAR